MVLSDGLVDADVLQLAEAVFLVYLNECEWAGELVGGPEIFNEEVGDRNGFCSSCDSKCPTAWTGGVSWWWLSCQSRGCVE